MGLWDFLRRKKAPSTALEQGVEKTRRTFWEKLKSAFTLHGKIDEALLESLEEAFLLADVGTQTTQKILTALQEKARKENIQSAEKLPSVLAPILVDMLSLEVPQVEARPHITLFVGVNGVGKTTTLGKLAYLLSQEGYKVILGAADTFRAAAVEQLRIWAQRAQVTLVEKGMGADPGAIAHATAEEALKQNADFVLIDTAGRLHNKTHLMQELGKIRRVLNKKVPGAPHETLLVVDATTGQNALAQATAFCEVTPLSAFVLTKLDGTAKGGIAFSLVDRLQIPIKYIGVGESAADLLPFDPQTFVETLLKDTSITAPKN
ncbi:MAG: signal recognition particle-docking protein FtsY [Bacteroidia bacterium]